MQNENKLSLLSMLKTKNKKKTLAPLHSWKTKLIVPKRY